MLILPRILQYPEPEATGTGTSYSLASVQEEAFTTQDSSSTEVEHAADPAPEYTLTFDEADNINDSYRAILTAAARETDGLDAATASKLFHTLTGKLNEESQRLFLADDAALKSEWGRNFEPRVQQTLAFMKRSFAQAGCTEEECAMFENPRAIRVMNKLMKVFSEGKAVGSAANATATTQMSKEEFIRTQTKEIIEERKKPEPNQQRLRELRQEINRAVGLNV